MEKKETIEEAAKHYSENWEEITGLGYDNCYPCDINELDFIAGAKWQQERMHSEEEVLEILNEFNYSFDSIRDSILQWFEQYKKK